MSSDITKYTKMHWLCIKWEFYSAVNRIMYLHKCTNLFYDLEMHYQISNEKPLLIKCIIKFYTNTRKHPGLQI